MSKFLNFREQPRPGFRTKLWSVEPKKGGLLGMVGWYAAWRRYCFQPERAVFDAECLRDIAAFTDDETKKHKAKK